MIKIFTDGASRGNPGPSSCAFVFVKGGEVVKQFSKYLGRATNNIAEYEAVIMALKAANDKSIELYSDSRLVISQLKGKFKVKSPHLIERHKTAMNLLRRFESCKLFHVPRENRFIRLCDALCNRVLDNQNI